MKGALIVKISFVYLHEKKRNAYYERIKQYFFISLARQDNRMDLKAIIERESDAGFGILHAVNNTLRLAPIHNIIHQHLCNIFYGTCNKGCMF